MKTPSMGNVYLLGPDSDVYEKPQPGADLIALKSRVNENLVARVLGDFAVHWWHRVIGWRFRVSLLPFLFCDLFVWPFESAKKS
jgi:Ni,Fe-hydrogenase I cytochrome b subunit